MHTIENPACQPDGLRQRCGGNWRHSAGTGPPPGAIEEVMDDDDLIAALADGDDTALRELFTRHAPWLAARIRKALPPEDVEDVLQETFLAAWKGARTYTPRGTP